MTRKLPEVPEGFPGRVTFIKSASKLSQAPHTALPEICFCGRSNVGKSSLINTLCGRRQLARVSSTPGRTRLINFFNVQDTLCLVDLPGYGWAKVPAAMKRSWGSMVQSYLADRPQLVLAVSLVDVRRDPGVEEKELLAWFQAQELPTLVIATKVDKVKRSQLRGRLNTIAKALGVLPKHVLPFSSLNRDGRERVWATLLSHTAREE